MINIGSAQLPVTPLPNGACTAALDLPPPELIESAFWARKKFDGRNITSTDVLNAYKTDTTSLRPGFFMQKLSHYRILHEGQFVTPERVLREFNKNPGTDDKCQLAVARFKQTCCLKNEFIDAQEVTTDEVLSQFPDTPRGRLGVARFKTECCLTGLDLHGHQVTVEEVANDYRLATYPQGLTRFFSECCLRGLMLHNQPVTTEMVLNRFQACDAEQLRFLEQCFLRNMTINNKPVKPDYLARNYSVRGELLGLGRVKERCCFGEHLLFKRRVSTDEVFDAYQTAGAFKELRNFVAECCLRGLTLGGQPVNAQSVLNEYMRTQCTRDVACFLAALTLRGKKLNDRYLNNDQVVQAFQNASPDFTVRPLEFLLRRIGTLPDHVATDEAQQTLQLAHWLIGNITVTTEKVRHQACTLHFTAMQFALPVGEQVPSAEQVWQMIENLRNCFNKSRLKFFFLTHLFRTGQRLHGSPVSRSQITTCISRLPQECGLRKALEQWFSEHGTPPAGRENPADGPVLTPLLSKSLQIIDQINSSNRKPVLLVSGLFARYLQGMSPTYDDIDVIGTEAGIRILMDRMTDTHTSVASSLHTHANIRPFSGCAPLITPQVMTLTLTAGDLNLRTLRLKGHLYSSLSTAVITTVTVPGLGRPVQCLSLLSETQVLSHNLKHLADNLKSLTMHLQNGASLIFPCPVLFRVPQTTQESVCELLLHCLITLHQAEQILPKDGSAEAQRSAAQLRELLQDHPYREQFVAVVQNQLEGPDSDLVNNRRRFFQTLLALLTHD